MDTLSVTTTLLQDLGGIGATAFGAVALGDLLTGLGNLIVQKAIAPMHTHWSDRVVFWWSMVDDAWAEIRAFINKISLFSHERPAYSKGSNEGKSEHNDDTSGK